MAADDFYTTTGGPKIDQPKITVTYSADASSYEFTTTNAGNLARATHIGDTVPQADGAGVIQGRTTRKGDRATSITLILPGADFATQEAKLCRAGAGGYVCTFPHPDDASDVWVISSVTKTGERGAAREITVEVYPLVN